MSYASLGNACHASGSAFVSNHKYLPPLDSVYFEPYTQMNRYPGQSTFAANRGRGRFAEQIRTFYGKNSNPVLDVNRNTVSTIKHPHDQKYLDTTDSNKLQSIYSKQTVHQSSKDATCTSCSVGGDNDSNLYPILNPMFNLREVAKHLILLEDHLFHSGKRCTQCIIKHLLTIEAFLEEAVTLDKEQKHISRINSIYTDFKNIQKSIHDQINNNSLTGEFCQKIAQDLRSIRKPISMDTYNLC